MSSVPRGWYPDPEAERQLRYWDGREWTGHVQAAGPELPVTPPTEPEPPPEPQPEPRAPRPFTSALPVAELVLLREAGFDPVGIVSGGSLHRIDFRAPRPDQSHEVVALSTAMHRGRDSAVTRMRDAAAQLGAHGVVGVRLELRRYEWAPRTAELLAVGTAVRERGAGGAATHPFTTLLAGVDLEQLLDAGYRPAAVVVGSFVQHVAYHGLGQAPGQSDENFELEDHTRTLADARRTAMERMEHEAGLVGAAGVVGVELSERSHGWGPHVIEFSAIGTAVVEGTARAGASRE